MMMMMMMMMMMTMMNCFCGMVDRRKAFSLISSRDHCQRSSPSRISHTPRAGFEPAKNLSSGLNEWICAVVITTTITTSITPVNIRKPEVFCFQWVSNKPTFLSINASLTHMARKENETLSSCHISLWTDVNTVFKDTAYSLLVRVHMT